MKRLLPFCFLFLILCLTCQKDLTGPEHGSFAWPTASPESQEMDSMLLTLAFDHASELDFIYGIVVTRQGYLVGERYYNGTNRNSAHNIRSVSKSFLSALYGIALEQGHISTLDTPMVDYLSDYKKYIVDEKMNDVSLMHLLTMKGGFDSDTNIMFSMMNSPNWIQTALQQQLLFYPGSTFRYSTVGTHLLSVILRRSIGKTTRDFADTYLCKPLGIRIDDWATDPQGYHVGGSEMFLTPRDMARFGWLYMNDGKLDGRQIVPAEWIQLCLTPTYQSRNGEWGSLENYGYGYLWWLGKMRDYDVHMALGFGGQFIFNFPELQMTLTVLSNSQLVDWEAADAQEQQVTELVADYFLAAVKK